MKIEVCYYVNGADVVEVIDRDCCETKEQAGRAAIEHAKSNGSRYFPFFKVLEEQQG